MLTICITYTFFYCFMSCGWTLSNRKIRKKDEILLVLFLFSLVLISANCIPSKSDDLYRHYRVMHFIKEGSLSLIEAFTVYSEQFLPVWGSSLYYLSYLPHYFWLIVAYVGMTFLALFFMIELFKNKQLKKSELSLFLFFFFALNPIAYINSGIRNQSVFGIGTLMIYLYMNGKLKIVFLLLCVVFLGFIHPAVYIIPICYFAGRLLKGYSWILIAWASLIKYIVLPIINKIFKNISYLTNIVEKLNYYFYERKDSLDYRQIIAILFLVAVLLYIHIIVKNNSVFEKTFYMKYHSFYTLILIITIGSVGTTLFLRFCYIVGWFALPSIMLFVRNCKMNKALILISMLVVTVLLNVYNGITIIVYRQFGLV